MRQPPSGFTAIELDSLSDTELRDAHYELASWIEEALSTPAEEAPSEDVYDAIHGRLSAISQIRAQRQREDLGTSDGGRF
tara:strand:- start:286 stop:525 length:240 start_codon:yes stop_codon:yes gene_type:complete